MLFRAFLKLNTYIKKTLLIYRRPLTTYQELDSCKPQMQWCWDLEFFGPSNPLSNRFGYRSRLFKPISFFLDFGLRSGRLRKDKICLRCAAEQMDLDSKHHYAQLDLFCPQADATSSAITSDLHFPGGQLWIPKSFFLCKMHFTH